MCDEVYCILQNLGKNFQKYINPEWMKNIESESYLLNGRNDSEMTSHCERLRKKHGDYWLIGLQKRVDLEFCKTNKIYTKIL